MRIARLQIENFRSFKTLDVSLPQVCAIVGPNNSGKSNLLEALRRVLARSYLSLSDFSEDDVHGRDPSKDIHIEVTFDAPVEYSRGKNLPSADIQSLSFTYTRYKVNRGDNKKGDRRLEQKSLDASGDVPVVQAQWPKKGQPLKFEPVLGVPSAVRAQVPLIYLGATRTLSYQMPSNRNSLLRPIMDDIERDFHDPTNLIDRVAADGTTSQIARSARLHELTAEIMEVLRTPDLEQLEKTLRSNALRLLGFDPSVDTENLNIFFSPFNTVDFYRNLELRVREGGYEIGATDLGGGMQNAIVIAILQSFEQMKKAGAIFLIEEPEMFLHPQMQRSVSATLQRIGRTNQVIYTTHSPHFLSVPNFEQVLMMRKTNGVSHAQFSNLPSTEKRREKLTKELDPERGEMFFASRVLVVEGDTEKLALPVYADRLGLDLDNAGATIVEVSGKRNLPEFVEIATSFGIPTGLLYDRDSSDFDNKRDEEEIFNGKLDDYADPGADVHVWQLNPKYEKNLRQALGEDKYIELCQRFPNRSKAVRARLIALEQDTPIPEPFEEILKWLAGQGD